MILDGLKRIKWSDSFFLIAWKSRDDEIKAKIFFIQNRNFGTIEKIIWFWSTFKKESRVNYDVTRRYRTSKLVKLGAKNRQINNDIWLYSASYDSVSWIFFLIKSFFLVFSTGIFHLLKFFNSLLLCKIFWEKLRNQAKLHKIEKLWYLLFRIISELVIPKAYFWRETRLWSHRVSYFLRF